MSSDGKDLGEVYLTIEECAEKTGFSEKAIYNKVHREEIPFVKRGRSLRFPRSEIDKWMQEEEPSAA